MRDSAKIETVLVTADHDVHPHALTALDPRRVMGVIFDWGVEVAAEFLWHRLLHFGRALPYGPA
jgi:hypothetical protein